MGGGYFRPGVDLGTTYPPSPFSMLLKWKLILVANAIVLYDEANDFSSQNSNIETGGGGLQVNFHKYIKKCLFDVSVPNFNVTDCRLVHLYIFKHFTVR